MHCLVGSLRFAMTETCQISWVVCTRYLKTEEITNIKGYTVYCILVYNKHQ